MTEKLDAINAMIEGLEKIRDDLIADRDIFLKAQGLDEQIATEQEARENLELDVESAKEDLAEARAQKLSAISITVNKISAGMNEVLPVGEGIIQIEDNGSVEIGWIMQDVFRPYAGLSGSEERQFGMALAHTLIGESPNKVLICEAAEIDDMSMIDALNHWLKLDIQVIVNTCHKPAEVPEGWHLEELT